MTLVASCAIVPPFLYTISFVVAFTTVTAAVSAVEYPVIGTSLPSSIVVYVQWLFWPDALTESTVTFMPPATASYVMILLAGGGASCFSFHLPIRGFGFCAATEAMKSSAAKDVNVFISSDITMTIGPRVPDRKEPPCDDRWTPDAPRRVPRH